MNSRLTSSSEYKDSRQRSNSVFGIAFTVLALIDFSTIRFFDLPGFEACVVFLLGCISSIFALEAAVRLKIL